MNSNEVTRCDDCKQSTPRAIPGYCTREAGHAGSHYRTADYPQDPNRVHPLTAMLVAKGRVIAR